MYLSELVKLDKKELNKKSKAEMIECITSHSWQYTQMESEIKNLKSEIEKAKAPYNQAKLLLLGALSIDPQPISEYDDKPNLDVVDLCNLIGRLLSEWRK